MQIRYQDITRGVSEEELTKKLNTFSADLIGVRFSLDLRPNSNHELTPHPAHPRRVPNDHMSEVAWLGRGVMIGSVGKYQRPEK